MDVQVYEYVGCVTVSMKSNEEMGASPRRCRHPWIELLASWQNPLHWRHNGCDSISNHQPHDCLLNRLFRRRWKKTSKLRVNGLCVENSPGTGEFSTQMASDSENVSIWWRHRARWRETGNPPRFISLPFAKNASLLSNPIVLIHSNSYASHEVRIWWMSAYIGPTLVCVMPFCVVCVEPSYMNRCWLIFNWKLMKKLKFQSILCPRKCIRKMYKTSAIIVAASVC